MSKRSWFAAWLLFIGVCLPISAITYKVSNLEQYNAAAKVVLAGDSIVLSNGVWRDVKLVLKAVGQSDKPIVITVEQMGKVTLEGNSSIHFSGEYIHISGLIFINGYTANKCVIEFKTGSAAYANHCVVSDCVIDRYSNPIKTDQDAWVGIYGKSNTVRNCYFAGKTNQGTTCVVWPNDEMSQNNKHHIYRNYFGYRPALGNNGGETIRIGTSQVSKSVSATIVESNYFERCNGEVEIISVKSCENQLLHNTFFECEGGLTLRHGDRNIVAGNFFNGNGKRNTGGIRVINEGHKIYNNLFYKLRGTEFRSALPIMNAIENTPLNGYHQVKDVLIAHNSFVDCSTPWQFSVGAGERERVLQPQNVRLVNNIVYSPTEPDLIKEYQTNPGIVLDNNVLIGSRGVQTGKGLVNQEVELQLWNGFLIPIVAASTPILTPIITDLRGVSYGQRASYGAFGDLKESSSYQVASADNSGPLWYKPACETQKAPTPARVISVEPGKDILYNAIRKSKPGDILELKQGVHILTKKCFIAQDITLRAAQGLAKRPIVQFESDASTVIGFEIQSNARFNIDGIAVCGDSDSKNPAKYCFATHKENAQGYKLIIENSEFFGFNVTDGGAFFKAYTSSFADSIAFINSHLHDCFRGFSLAEQKDEDGKYNAEYIYFENSIFNRITQWVLDYSRLGIDESTLGGNLTVDHCVFDEVNDREGQSVLRQNGIKTIRIQNSIFSNSEAKHPIRLVGKDHSISNSVIYLCGKVSATAGAKVESIMETNPKYAKNAFTLNPKSPLLNRANDGDNIGLKR